MLTVIEQNFYRMLPVKLDDLTKALEDLNKTLKKISVEKSK